MPNRTQDPGEQFVTNIVTIVFLILWFLVAGIAIVVAQLLRSKSPQSDPYNVRQALNHSRSSKNIASAHCYRCGTLANLQQKSCRICGFRLPDQRSRPIPAIVLGMLLLKTIPVVAFLAVLTTALMNGY